MARMSIDDMFLRDPRVAHLAELVAWSRRETRGCLHEIYSLCYDRIAPYLRAVEIDRAAALDQVSPVAHPNGFTAAMVESGLARAATATDRVFQWRRKDGSIEKLRWPDQIWSGKIYIGGAAERIGYQLAKKEAGSRAGRKSANSRGKDTQPPFNHNSNGGPTVVQPDIAPTPKAMPSSPDLVLAPDLATPLVGDRPEPESPANAGSKPSRRARQQVPSDWMPSGSLMLTPLELEQVAAFRDHHRGKGNTFADLEAAWRTWQRNAKRFDTQRRGPSASTPGPTAQALAELHRLEQQEAQASAGGES